MSTTAMRERGSRLSTEQTLVLWHEYRDSGDRSLRDRLVLTLAPMVKYIVFRKAREMPASCEVDDFISCGLEALIRSIDRFDPERGTTLEQFAWTRIHGAVLDEMRRADWAPRSLRRRDRQITAARESFNSLYGRRPTREELAAAVGMTPAELAHCESDLARAQVGSLNAPVHAEDELAVERIETLISDDPGGDPELTALGASAKARFREAFARLGERDRKVAVLLYVNNLTLREVGEILGVTESRVCQLHAQILKRLRRDLEDDESMFAGLA